jgi:signal transduction histidine kinase
VSDPGQRVLVLAPLGADAANMDQVLRSAGIGSEVCLDLVDLAARLATGCGALVLTEEAMASPDHVLLAAELGRQPPWSDVPIILITTGGHLAVRSGQAVALFGERANLTLIERPLRALTLVAAVHAALRARGRQYQVRELLDDRERLLASLEERVAERTASLRQMVEELEAFSYSVSHDLRSPLRVLEGYARVLLEDYASALPPPAQDMLDRIARASRRMDRLTQEVLAYTRVSRAEITLESLDLDLVLRAVIEQYPAILASRHLIRLRTPLGRVQGHLPSLIQCFSNLLENALKFVREGEPADIEVFSEANGNRVRISVRDRGVGIEPAQQKRIFGIFERAAHPHVPGTGIGLAIVKKAAERMGGTVGVESVAGQGARFWLEFVGEKPESATESSGAVAGRAALVEGAIV